MAKIVTDPRILADGTSPTGTLRYNLLKDCFQHAQSAFVAGRFLETIPILESIIFDRLGSLIGGSLGHKIALKMMLRDFQKYAKTNSIDEDAESGRGKKAPLPQDIVLFIQKDVAEWIGERNEAVHGMAKLRSVDDLSFLQRYAELENVA